VIGLLLFGGIAVLVWYLWKQYRVPETLSVTQEGVAPPLPSESVLSPTTGQGRELLSGIMKGAGKSTEIFSFFKNPLDPYGVGAPGDPVQIHTGAEKKTVRIQ
jgi:hypothetical protein